MIGGRTHKTRIPKFYRTCFIAKQTCAHAYPVIFSESAQDGGIYINGRRAKSIAADNAAPLIAINSADAKCSRKSARKSGMGSKRRHIPHGKVQVLRLQAE